MWSAARGQRPILSPRWLSRGDPRDRRWSKSSDRHEHSLAVLRGHTTVVTNRGVTDCNEGARSCLSLSAEVAYMFAFFFCL